MLIFRTKFGYKRRKLFKVSVIGRIYMGYESLGGCDGFEGSIVNSQ